MCTVRKIATWSHNWSHLYFMNTSPVAKKLTPPGLIVIQVSYSSLFYLYFSVYLWSPSVLSVSLLFSDSTLTPTLPYFLFPHPYCVYSVHPFFLYPPHAFFLFPVSLSSFLHLPSSLLPHILPLTLYPLLPPLPSSSSSVCFSLHLSRLFSLFVGDWHYVSVLSKVLVSPQDTGRHSKSATMLHN